MSTDLALLRRYHEHADAFAFRELVQAHAGMVFATARRVTRDVGLAEDVAQETFLELARNASTITESVGAWLHRVAWRRACNAVRADGTRRRYEEAATVASLEGDRAEATWAELEPLIDEALNALPDKWREPLVEHFLEGRTQQDLAVRYGVSQSTVSRLLEAGIDELRRQLRRKEVLVGASLALLLAAHATMAPPPALIASLGKLAVSGVGANPARNVAATRKNGWTTMSRGWRLAVIGAVSVAAGVLVFVLAPRPKPAPAVAPLGAAVPPTSVAPRPDASNPTAPGQTHDWNGRAFCPMCAPPFIGGREPVYGIFIHAENGNDVVYDLRLPEAVADFHPRFCVPSMQDNTAVHIRGTVEMREGRRTLVAAALERTRR
jgi:RNA polymerase sigma factor (sigma-70 family)